MRAGARFVVPVAEHHDGFAMYDSAVSQWNAATMGPKRDLIGDLAAAVRQEDMVFGVSSHRAEHWWFFTTAGDALYAIALAWPGAELAITSLGTAVGLWDRPIASVELLGHAGPLQWRRDARALTVTLPPQPPSGHAYAFKIVAGT